MLSKDTLKLMVSEIVVRKAKVVRRRGKLMVVGSR
ncbi:hypothetical protein ABIA95_000193 [Bradyrhizobium sp. LA8.1]